MGFKSKRHMIFYGKSKLTVFFGGTVCQLKAGRTIDDIMYAEVIIGTSTGILDVEIRFYIQMMKLQHKDLRKINL